MAPPRKKAKLELPVHEPKAGLLRRPSASMASPETREDEDDRWQSESRIGESADPPFEVHIMPPTNATAEDRPAKHNESGQVRRYQSPYEDRLSFDYKIVNRPKKGTKAPPDWFECKSYTTLKSGGHRYRVGDVVSVLHIPEQLNDTAAWVAQVIDIRGVTATDDSSTVYALIVWLYRPEHLPGRRKVSHYEHEVMPSNYLQIIEGAAIGNHVTLIPTVQTSSTVVHSKRKPCDYKDQDIERVIWRQTLDYRNGRLSKILLPCICGEPVDFGKGQNVICEDQQCGIAHHEACVLLDAKSQRFTQKNGDQVNGTNAGDKKLEASPSKPSSLFGRIANAVTGHSKEESVKPLVPSAAEDGDEAATDGVLAENLYEAHFKNDGGPGHPLVAIVTDKATRTAVELEVCCPSCRKPMVE